MVEGTERTPSRSWQGRDRRPSPTAEDDPSNATAARPHPAARYTARAAASSCSSGTVRSSRLRRVQRMGIQIERWDSGIGLLPPCLCGVCLFPYNRLSNPNRPDKSIAKLSAVGSTIMTCRSLPGARNPGSLELLEDVLCTKACAQCIISGTRDRVTLPTKRTMQSSTLKRCRNTRHNASLPECVREEQ
jgi:hypothetical protein